MSDVTSQKDVRARIAEAATEDYELMRATFRAALEAEKTTWIACPHCKRKSEVQVEDWNARGKMIQLMLTEGFGRVPAGADDSERGFILNRTVVNP